MLINAYETSVGSPFRIKDRVENTIKTLILMKSLTPTKKENVFVLTSDDDPSLIPVMAFPVSFQGHDRKLITVYDERPMRNKANVIISPDQATIMRLAAFLQQDALEHNFSALKGCRLQATKAFVESIAPKMTRTFTLGVNDTMTLKVLLGHFFVSQQESSGDQELITTNLLRELFGVDQGYVMGVIEGIPPMKTLADLLAQIKLNPILFKMKGLSLKDFIQLVGTLAFASLGPPIIAASLEAPCLFTAFVYGAIRFRALAKTPLGIALDPKHNRNTLESFNKTIDYTYNLS